MTGTVDSKLEAVLRVQVFGPHDSVETACIVDTGFSGALTLPPRLVSRLDLRWLSIQESEVADGRIVPCDVYSGAVLWAGRRLLVEVDEAETDPLLGMALLKGFELRIQVEAGGGVHLSALR